MAIAIRRHHALRTVNDWPNRRRKVVDNPGTTTPQFMEGAISLGIAVTS
jgi:hypothetical protein